MEHRLSDRDYKAIRDYIRGARIPTGRISPAKLIKRLKAKIEDLQEYDLFQTAGAFQDTYSKRLQEYRALLDSLVAVDEWYRIVNQGDETGEWMREFHRIGTCI